MPTSPLNKVIQHLLADLRPDGDGMTDAELLARFLSSRDDNALAALVRRHAPMVWGVCCRLLHNHHDAEDAFQATFLVLVRKAADVPRQAVANWLYGVARQSGVRLRATTAKRGRRETQVVNMPEPTVAHVRDADLQFVVDEELGRMPDHYRGVIVLCDLEGMTRKEAARQLGIPEGSVASRLARARVLLAKRLTRRGVVFSGGSAGAVLSAGSASASAPPALVASTIKAASLLAAGRAAGVISATVAALTEGVVNTMFMGKIKSVLAVVLVVAALAGVAGLIYQTQAAEQPKAKEEQRAAIDKAVTAHGGESKLDKVPTIAVPDREADAKRANPPCEAFVTVELTGTLLHNGSYHIEARTGRGNSTIRVELVPSGDKKEELTKNLQRAVGGVITVRAPMWYLPKRGEEAGFELHITEAAQARIPKGPIKAPDNRVYCELRGTLLPRSPTGGVFNVETRNAANQPKFLVQLARTEDKNNALDFHLEKLGGGPVTVHGYLEYYPGIGRAAELWIGMREIEQISRTKPANVGNLKGEEKLRVLIDKVLAAHGGEDKLSNLQAFTMTIKHSNGETQQYFVQPPKNFRWETQHRDSTSKRIVILFPNGRRWWTKEPNEDAKPLFLTGAELSIEAQLDYVKFFGPRQVLRLKDADHKVALLDEQAKIGDHAAVGVEVTGPHCNRKMYFDKETHLLVKQGAVTYSDYKKFDGIPIAQKENDGHFMPEVTDFRVVDKFDAKLFERP